MKMALIYHLDPGHGWIEVDWTQLKILDLNPTDFSRHSYLRRNTFFLEEDCDAPKFIEAYKAKFGREPKLIEKHGGEWIRRLNPIH
jgi:hypothetical protein